MIFPKGEVVHQNLSTEYTDVPDLLSTLTSNGFAGVVEVELPREKGAFFIRNGQVLSAIIESEPEQITSFGREAMDELLNLTSKEVGTLNIYKLSPAQVDAIVSRLCSEIVFKGLMTDFVKLDKFIQKLSMERHTGYIEVFTKKNQIMGTLFLKEGELVDLHLPSESEYPSLSEPKAIPTFLEDVVRQGAVFDVYRSFIESVPTGKNESEFVVGRVVKDNDENIIKAEEPSYQEEGEEKEKEKETEIEVGTEVETREETIDDVEEHHTEVGPNGRGDVLGKLQEVITRAERFVDGFSQQGIFLRAFKRALIEKSDLYPFLDPFTDQFDYRQGEITLDEEVELAHFATGIADCFNLTLSHLKKEFPKNMNLSPSIRAEMESKFRLYEDAMKRSGVQSVPPMFFK
jgi:hypothetical protein